MILLNKIPVLDKGFVALFDSSGSSQKLNQLAEEYFYQQDGRFLIPTVSTLTIVMKCPLFVQLNLSLFGFKITNLPLRTGESLEAYIPSISDVNAPDLATSRDIVEDMTRTTEALHINPKAYQKDGCNKFTAQLLTPINTYTTILVHGMYNDWDRYVSQNNAPNSIAAYADAVNQILRTEWQ